MDAIDTTDTTTAHVDSLEQRGWCDDMLLGFEAMDQTHQEFVELIMALVDCNAANAVQRLADIESHTRAHFEQEREWMASSGFPAADCHNDEHAAVLDSISGVLARLHSGQCDAQRAQDLGRKLAQWFPGHAVYLDSALATWMTKKRFGAAPVVLKRHLAPR
jgi:hemerythrin-like metal-binding protein